MEDYQIKIYHPGEQGLDHVFKIREKVFTQEQGIPASLDRDGKDAYSFHLLLSNKKSHIATGRLYIDHSIGNIARIAVLQQYRGMKLGGRIVSSLEEIGKSKGLTTFQLFPHSYLLNFYLNLGYVKDPEFEQEVAGYKLYRMYKNKKG